MKLRAGANCGKGLVADASATIGNTSTEFQKLSRLARRVLAGKMVFPLARTVLSVGLACSAVTDSQAQTAPSVFPNPAGDTSEETVVLPESVPDPIEPFNRVVWGFNKGLMTGVVRPTGRAYRAIVAKPVRTAVGNFGTNITYPGRLINNMLQGKWNGARDETYRFLCNTVVGWAGFFDVATELKIPRSPADFGQTFGKWGWKPGCYLMLPIFGPSNERDTLGLAADTAANPLTYFTPYSFAQNKPLTYFSPYTYASFATTYNNFTDTVEERVRFSKAEMDPYATLQYVWTFVRNNRVADLQLKGKQDQASLETLQAALFSYQDPEFLARGKTRSVLIPTTQKRLKFTFWMQTGEAPIIYIVPGLGSHRLAGAAIALAELVYWRGYSAVCVSNPLNFEFMEHASTSEVPAYTPVDVQDLHAALGAIDRRLEKAYPHRVGSRALIGYSLGGYHSLFVAATASTNEAPVIKFDRYVAIHSPVRLLYGVSQLDNFFQAPLAWPAAERTDKLENTFMKIAALSQGALKPEGSLPFDAVESKFLIGAAYRFILRDIIYSSQKRTNQGVLDHPIKKMRREPVYHEILQYSYDDYWKKFVVPYYLTRGVDLTAPETLDRAANLRTYEAGLRANENVRLVVNRNDILLSDEDLKWLQATFGERITIFEKGGHLGNLSDSAVQGAILQALDGLRFNSN
jgi:ABC-type transporter lipoprotein component MlaA